MNKNLNAIPRIKLAHLPTPLEEAKNLSKFLGGPRIFIKRDDLTGISMGGNKVRKLEILMADAISKNADYIVTGGGTQSNHTCQTAAVCNRLGLKSKIILKEPADIDFQGNLLLEKLMGTEIKFTKVNNLEEIEKEIRKEMDELKNKGNRPYYIPLGGSNGFGALAYSLAIEEIAKEAEEKEIKIDRIFTACGTGGTMAGLLLGKKLFNLPFEITGISVGASMELKENIYKVAGEGSGLIGLDGINMDEIRTCNDYIGKEYGHMTEGCKEAIEIVAKTEGIFIDPVYTSKCMAGIIDFIRKGHIGKKETIVFIHTGGIPALFSYKDKIL